MTWTCPTCGRDYPDSEISVPSNDNAYEAEGCEVCWVSPVATSRFVRPDDTLQVDETDLYGVYSLLADAIKAAATGNPNRCISLAADAKEKVFEIYRGAEK